MIRTFLAVELSDDLRAQISRVQQNFKARLSRDLPRDVRVSWVRPAAIHLTLKFLGDIDEQLVTPLQTAMANVLGAMPAVDVPLDRIGGFPSLQQPRVLWVGPSDSWEQGEEARRLADVHRAVEACCVAMGCAPEPRPLSPHLTLARIKEGTRQVGQALAKIGALERPLALPALSVKAVVLMKSELRPTGSIYTKLWEVPVVPQTASR
ncbi:MAG: RNA 2',3'-cyclic phosphodiesterase [Nitrospira sp.]